MAALANRLAAETAAGFFRRSFNLIRTLTTSAAATPAAVEDKKPKRRKKKNLFEVAQFLPNWGIGYRMAKSHWRDVSYEITKINLYKGGRHGKAWGIRHKAGIPAVDAPAKIGGVNKPGWKYFPQSKKKVTETKKAEETIPA